MSHRLEIELLIACALPPSHPQIGDRVRSSAVAPIDWNKLRELGAYHRVQPLLYKRLSQHATTIVPGNVLAELAAEYRAGATRNLSLAGELISLSKAFRAADIPILPHKGPLLALAAYGDLAMRQFSDLDILIHPHDLPRAIALLAGLNYRPAEDLAWLSPSALLRWNCELSCDSAAGTSIDLQWGLTPVHYPLQLNPEILWRSRAFLPVGGTDLPTVGPEALLLLLAVHGAKHCWEAIGWLADVAWLRDASPAFDWQRTTELARESDCEPALVLVRSLVDAVFYGQPCTDPLGRRVLDRWHHAPAESPLSPEVFSFAAALTKKRLLTLRHLLGLVFWPTAADWKIRSLPEGLFWLYAPIRISRLARKYLLRAPAAKTIQ